MRGLRCAGLGLLVGAVLPHGATAQGVDSVRTSSDTVKSQVPLPADTAKHLTAADTIKPPLAHAELPTLNSPSDGYTLTGAAILGSGAQTVGDLLQRIPGVTEFSTGWMGVPSTAAYLGDAARVRVFIDGLEYTSLDPHSGGSLDYSQIPLWPMESATIERSASEIRVYLNTWRVTRTTPYTRTDITTGDFQTNLYRGFFGRRYQHGQSLQIGVQQYGDRPVPGGATSDQLSFMGRTGWAGHGMSVDAMLMQVGTHRGASVDPFSSDSILALRSTRRDAYVRVGYGNPGDHAWAQAVASTSRYEFAYGSGVSSVVPADTTTPQGDTLTSAPQYLLTGGVARGGFSVSVAGRYLPSFNRGFPAGTDSTTNPDSTEHCCRQHGIFVPSARANYAWRGLGLGAYAQGRDEDSTSRSEVNASLRPVNFLRFSAAAGRASDHRMAGSDFQPNYFRGEAGLRIHDLWVSGGILSRDGTILSAPTLVKDSLVTTSDSAARATFVSLNGRLWKGIHIDAYGLRWDDSTGVYRPQFQTMTKLYVSTSLLNRFPDNSFHFYLALTHEYGSARYFPMAGGPVRGTIGYRRYGAQLEIRIERAVITYTFTNALGEEYNQVPGYLMPRRASVYGVRWEFWN